ncbi:MAG: 4-hydroxythreonine-4-phosphate dehydrogenase PdxA [Magnetococcus sp. WYHC-3]
MEDPVGPTRMPPLAAMPPLAITQGDPAGIGPEVLLKAHAQRPTGTPAWLFIGDPWILETTAHALRLPCPLHRVEHPGATIPEGYLGVLPTTARVDRAGFAFGRALAGHAASVLESLHTACDLALAGAVSALVTPPINKHALHLAGHGHLSGHTEILGERTGGHPVMMLAGGGLRVVLATIHIPLSQVPLQLTRERLDRVMGITLRALREDFGLEHPRLAVCGLNPHAGEEGAFGREELDLIAPVCTSWRQAGWLVDGPRPADTLFHEEARRNHDAVLAMYHDQGLAPLKMLAFGRAVNITLGLPVVRTSVDHGTAYDIAGLGVAHPDSFLEAAEWALAMAARRGGYPVAAVTR